MSAVRQLTFEAGELADKLHARTDLELYRKGLKTCRNFFPSIEGQLVSRSGSLMVRETKGSAAAHAAGPGSAANTKVRLLPFIFSNGQTYVLEFGDKYLRFISQAGSVESAPGVPYEIATPYSWSSLPSLQYAQVGNVMVLTQPGYDAQVLERLGHTNWTLGPQSYTPPAWPGMPYFEPRLDPMSVLGNTGFMSEPMIETSADFVGDPTHPAQEWIFAVTLSLQNKKTGKRYESLPFIVTRKYDGADTYPANNGTVTNLADHFIAIYKDRAAIISAYRLTSGPSPDHLVLGINIYRGRGRDFFGFLARTLRAKFVDVGNEPNFLVQPPIGTNPFRVYDSNGTVLRTEKPIAVAFYGDRLTYGGAFDNDKMIRVGTLFFSEQGQWDRFDVYKIPYATMTIEFDMATETRQEIRTIFPHQKLLVGTDAAVHSIWGAGGLPLSAVGAPDRRVETSVGCSHLRMIDVRGTAIFAEGSTADGAGSDAFAYGLAVHSLTFTDGYGKYNSTSLSSQAAHLFYGDGGGVLRAITDWAYAAKPWQLVWMVRRDGVLLSLTHNPASSVPIGTGGVAAPPSTGWARHDTDGLYENVCTVPEGMESAVYVVVNRTINGETRRYIERFTSRARLGGSSVSLFGTLSQHADDICLDSAKYYVGPPTTHLTGIDHLEGKSVWVLREGYPPLGPYVVVGGSIDIITPTPVGKPTYVGLPYVCDVETLAVGGEPERQKTLKGLLISFKDTRGTQVGDSLTHLRDVKQLRPTTGYNPITNETRTVVVSTTGTWDSFARAAVRQNLPLPCTITSLTRLIEMGGSSP